MRTIHKCVVPVAPEATRVSHPEGAVAVHVGAKNHGEVQVWYICDTDQPPTVSALRVFGTGHPLPPESEAAYLGTALDADGFHVWHLFVVSGSLSGRDQ